MQNREEVIHEEEEESEETKENRRLLEEKEKEGEEEEEEKEGDEKEEEKEEEELDTITEKDPEKDSVPKEESSWEYPSRIKNKKFDKIHNLNVLCFLVEKWEIIVQMKVLLLDFLALELELKIKQN